MGITGTQPALMYARAKAAGGTLLSRPPRAGATRVNYYGTAMALSVNATTRHFNFDRETWRVTERARGGQPGQLTIDVFGFTPAEGQEVIFGAGALTNRLFRGTIVRVSRTHKRLNEGRVVYRLTCLDWLYQLQGPLVTKRYTNQTATAILLDLLSTYAPVGFTTTTYVQIGLATIDEMQFTMVPLAAAVEQVLERIGGYSYWDFDKQLHAFTIETTGAVPESISSSNPHTQSLDYDRDIEGVRNSIQVEGQGSTVRAQVGVGATTIPVDDVSVFETSGTNYAKTEAQRLTYTGVAGVDGQSATTEPAIANPTTTLVPSTQAGSAFATGWSGYWAFTFVGAAGGETTIGSSKTGLITNVLGIPTDYALTSIDVGPTGTVARRIYRTMNGGNSTSPLYLVAEIADNTTTIYTDSIPDASLRATTNPFVNTTGLSSVASGSLVAPLVADPTTGLTASQQVGSSHPNGWTGYWAFTFVDSDGNETIEGTSVSGLYTNNSGSAKSYNLSSIDVGPTGTVARRVYRTKTGGAGAFYLLTTIGDNTTTTYADNTTDASLGPKTLPTANATTIKAGATALAVSDISVFPASGWAEAPGGQVFSYTARSASSGPGSLTGIPASGTGSLAAPIRSGGTVRAIPHLTGVSGVVETINPGESINILVITEDATSIATYGRREMPVQDRRLALDGCADRGAAVLSLLKDPRTSGSCASSDPKMHARRPLTISVSEWGIAVTVTVQSVTIRPEKDRPQPMADVQFASRSLEDLFVTLREIKERALIR